MLIMMPEPGRPGCMLLRQIHTRSTYNYLGCMSLSEPHIDKLIALVHDCSIHKNVTHLLGYLIGVESCTLGHLQLVLAKHCLPQLPTSIKVFA